MQQARPPFKLGHTGEDADTNFVMMVDRGPSRQRLSPVCRPGALEQSHAGIEKMHCCLQLAQERKLANLLSKCGMHSKLGLKRCARQQCHDSDISAMFCLHFMLFFIVTNDKPTNDKTLTFQVIVVNYEDAHTTMEAPDEDDESSYK